MKRNLYKVVFTTYDELTVSAFNAVEAQIVAQAKMIEANRPYCVRYVEVQNAYGDFVAIGGAARLEAVKVG